jgi:ABC-type transporter Mla subunit MlaD
MPKRSDGDAPVSGREDTRVFSQLQGLPANPTRDELETLIAAAKSAAAHLNARAEALHDAIAQLQSNLSEGNDVQINRAAGRVLRRLKR